jgi:peptidoglycan-associated lipoprotein
MKRRTALVIGVASLVGAVACHKNQPPVVPADAPTRRPRRRSRAAALPRRCPSPRSCRPSPSRDDAISSASLDDLNKNSPLKPVFFEYDSDELSQTAQQTLNDNATLLKKYATWTVTIEGHCDERGTAEYNLALGERRAVNARAYLMSLGIAADRLRTVSYGKEFPFDPGRSEESFLEEPPGAFRHHREVSELMTHKLCSVLIGLVLVRARGRRICGEQGAPAADGRPPDAAGTDAAAAEPPRPVQRSAEGVNTRLDQQAEANRKALADRGPGDHEPDQRRARHSREAGRQQRPHRLAHAGSRRPAAVDAADGDAAGGHRAARPGRCGRGFAGRRRTRATAPNSPPAASPSLAASPRQIWDAAYSDYTSGNYDLAVLGFEAYIRNFPKSDSADDAQVLVCAAYLADKKYEKAVEACDTAIRTYPNGNAIPDAYFRKGLALADLKDLKARRRHGKQS